MVAATVIATSVGAPSPASSGACVPPARSVPPHGSRLWSAFCRVAQPVLDLLLPPRCACCSADLPAPADEALFCTECRRALAMPRPAACARCGDHLPPGIPSGCCRRCRTAPPPFSSVIYLGTYHDALRDAILSIKKSHQEPLAVALIELLWRSRGHELAQLETEVVVPMPMHWLRRLERGANAPDVLAERLARRLRIPTCPMLARRRHTVPQNSLARHARLTNLRQAFRMRSDYDCRGARVLLVDDVLTTGTTCSEATNVLLRAGAVSVAVAVLARAEGPV